VGVRKIMALKSTPKTTNTKQGAIIEQNVGGLTAEAAPAPEKTRSLLARIFIISFLIIIGLFPTILLLLGTIDVEGFKNMVLTLAGVLGGPLGIMITSYFKEGKDS